MKLKYVGEDLLNMIYPRICPGCGMPLNRREKVICLYCISSIPKTGFIDRGQNPVERLFYGRMSPVSANAYMYFRKSGISQRLMHQIKYNGNKELGFHLGMLFGNQVVSSGSAILPDIVTCIPLHPEKKKKRGYNQSEEIARGFAGAVQRPFMPDLVTRNVNNSTQTRRKRYQRWENTESVFNVDMSVSIEHKVVALIDDVITTGATMEACSNAILKVGMSKVSLYALCLAIN